MVLTFLQAVVEDTGGFWPQEAGSWLALIVSAIAVATAIIGGAFGAGKFRQWIDDEKARTDREISAVVLKLEKSITDLRQERETKLEHMQERIGASFKGQGERIEQVGNSCSKHDGRLDGLDSKLNQVQLEVNGSTRDAGALRQLIEGVQVDVRELEDRERWNDRRLTRLEATTGLPTPKE